MNCVTTASWGPVGEISSYVFLPFREGDPTLLRGFGDGRPPVLLATAKDASLASLKRLEHEYALRAELKNLSAR